jgi:dephospho-CoA kinase
MTVWFVLGPIGAGKSTFIQIISETYPHLEYLSADIVKRDLQLSYGETREKMAKIIKEHIDRRISFITEGTGQHDELYDLLKEYKEDPAIDLKVTYIDVPLETALHRNRSRDRVLSDETVTEVHSRCTIRKNLWIDFNCEYLDYKSIMTENHNLPKAY